MRGDVLEQLVILSAFCSISLNGILWSGMGMLRKISELVGYAQRTEVDFKISDVAVVIAAHNEELALPLCLSAITKSVPAKNIFVGDDASSDNTAKIVKQFRCKIFSAKVNIGKSKVLDSTIRKFSLCAKYKAILVLDADSQIDTGFLMHALPILGQRDVAVVAGHVVSREPTGHFALQHVLHLYRKRLYFLLQTFFRFGQTWTPINFSVVAPGFASLYRADVISQLDIAASGLVIEDINMTFEVHKKRLGRIAYSPKVRCTTEEPSTLNDYSRQIKRWNLGLWQTIGKQGLWPSKFWVFLTIFILELLVYSTSVAALAIFSGAALFKSGLGDFWIPTMHGLMLVPILYLPITLILAEILISIISAICTSDWRIALCAPLFLVLRIVDIFWALATIPLAFVTKSDGRWKSPERRMRA